MVSRLSHFLGMTLLSLVILAPAGSALAVLGVTDQATTPFVAGRYLAFLDCTVINKSGETIDGAVVSIKDDTGAPLAGPTGFANIQNGHAKTLSFQIPYAAGLRGGGYCHVEFPEGSTVFVNLVLRDSNTKQSLAEADGEQDLYGKLVELENALELDGWCGDACPILTRTITSGMLFGRYLSLFECTIVNKSGEPITATITIKNEDAVELASYPTNGTPIPHGETRTLSFPIPYEPGLLAESYCHVEVPHDSVVVGSHKLIDINTKQTLAESKLRFDVIEFVEFLINSVDID